MDACVGLPRQLVTMMGLLPYPDGHNQRMAAATSRFQADLKVQTNEFRAGRLAADDMRVFETSIRLSMLLMTTDH